MGNGGAYIELPFPSAKLSGHNTGHWGGKSLVVAKYREWAKNATIAARARVPEVGDIRLIVTFYPPDRRGDRINFPNRMKPGFDGIADGLTNNCGFKVNDNRFVPSYIFAEPVKRACVTVVVGAAELAVAA